MAFQVNVFTNDGLKTLSQISATNRLFIDRVFAIDDVINDNELVSESAAHFAAMKDSNVEAKIVSTGSDPETGMGRIVVSLRNTSSDSIIMHTIVVTAHTEVGGVPTSEATFFGCVTNSDLSLPATVSNPIKMNIAVAFNFSNDVEIVLSESNPDYLLSDEVSRFVTTHAASGASVGEAQEIRGNKKFLDSLTMDIQNDNGIIFSYGGTPQAKITDTGNMGIRFTALGDIADGDQCFEFYSNDTKIMEMLQQPDDTVSVRVVADLWAKNVSTDEIKNYFADPILLGTSISPSTDNVALGTAADPFNGMYSKSFVSYGDIDGTHVTVEPDSLSFFKIGGNWHEYKMTIASELDNGQGILKVKHDDAEILQIDRSLVHISCDVKTTGTTDSMSYTEHGLQGWLIKEPTSGFMKVGAIAMIAVNKDSGDYKSGSCGSIITVTRDNEIKYYKATGAGSGEEASTGLSKGTYCALHAWDASLSDDFVPVLVLCKRLR